LKSLAIINKKTIIIIDLRRLKSVGLIKCAEAELKYVGERMVAGWKRK